LLYLCEIRLHKIDAVVRGGTYLSHADLDALKASALPH
jgi:hypothetical protein